MNAQDRNRRDELRLVLAKLQVQLAKLDKLKAPIAAIHLDAAIQELRKTIALSETL